MDAVRQITVVLAVEVSDDDMRAPSQIGSAVVAAVREGRPYVFGETHMSGVSVRVAETFDGTTTPREG